MIRDAPNPKCTVSTPCIQAVKYIEEPRGYGKREC